MAHKRYRRSHQVIAMIEFFVGVIPVSLVMFLATVYALSQFCAFAASGFEGSEWWQVIVGLPLFAMIYGPAASGVLALWSTVGPVATGAGARRTLSDGELLSLLGGCLLACLGVLLAFGFLGQAGSWRFWLVPVAPLIVGLHTIAWGFDDPGSSKRRSL